MTIPDEKFVRDNICAWAKENSRITKAYLYGSFLTRTTWPPNDIDVAVEINDITDETGYTYWLCEGDVLQKELSQQIKYTVHVEYFSKKTPTIKQGIEAGSEIIYQR